jgi:hypothetical protein
MSLSDRAPLLDTRRMQTAWRALVVIVLVTTQAHADPRPAVRISAEIDPLDVAVYKGWSLFSVIQPDAFGPWAIRFGTGRAYLPKAFTEGGGNKGWSFGFDPVTTAGVERFFRSRRGGLFVIAALGYANMVFTGPSGGVDNVRQVSLQIGGGYRYYPSDRLGFVISADLGGVSSFYQTHQPTDGADQFDVPIVSPIGELFVGWDFDIGQPR